MTTTPELGPHLFHDGYFPSPDELYQQIQRYYAEGWELVAVIPPTAGYSYSLVMKHPIREFPSWEEV